MAKHPQSQRFPSIVVKTDGILGINHLKLKRECDMEIMESYYVSLEMFICLFVFLLLLVAPLAKGARLCC